MSVPGNVVLSEVTSGALFVAVQQKLKQIFPQLYSIPTWVLSALWAIVSVIIIGYEWTPNANGGGALTITVPSLTVAIIGLWKLGEQFAINEILSGGNAILQGTSGARVKSTTPVTPPTPAGQPPLPPSKWEQK